MKHTGRLQHGTVVTAALTLVAVGALVITSAPAMAAPSKRSNGGKLLPVKIGTAAESASSQELFAGLDYGIYKKHGLDATYVHIESSADLAAALVSGSVNIADGSGIAAAIADAKGEDFVMIGSDIPVGTGGLWATKDIKAVKTLEGKSVGISDPGANSDYQLDEQLSLAGVPPGEITISALGTTVAEVAAMDSGTIAAADLSTTAASQLKPRTSFHKVTHTTSHAFPYHMWITTRSYLKTHEAVIKRFVAGENAALSYIHNPANATKVDSAITKYAAVTGSEVNSSRLANLKVKPRSLLLTKNLVRLCFTLAIKDGGATLPNNISKFYTLNLVKKK